MSAIDYNALAQTFAPPAGLPAFPQANFPAATPAPVPSRTDNITVAPYQTVPQDASGPTPGNAYGQSTGGFGALYDRLIAAITNLFSNFGAMLGGGAGPAAPPGSTPGTPAPPQTFFTSATANSVGDPHESLSGTTSAGTTVDQKWNSMISHPNLLDSNSFNGGYRVATAVTPANSAGITQNQSASVTTSGGATCVSLNADNSYSVVSNGQSLTLPIGRPQNLGNGETVTLNADKSLTIVDANASGGTITTSLRSNGTGGVDVTNDAKNVDLGGSLVGHADYLGGLALS